MIPDRWQRIELKQDDERQPRPIDKPSGDVKQEVLCEVSDLQLNK